MHVFMQPCSGPPISPGGQNTDKAQTNTTLCLLLERFLVVGKDAKKKTKRNETRHENYTLKLEMKLAI